MLGLRAAQPAAEQLLPTETIAMVTIKSWTDATNGFFKSSIGLLWNDDAMRPVREKFDAKLTNDVSASVEKEFKIKLMDHAELLKGQLTFAMTSPVEEGKSLGLVLIIDSQDKADTLKTRLEELRKKWTDAGSQIKTEKIRDVEFSVYQFTQAALQKAMFSLSGGKPDDIERDPEAEKTKIDLLVGQSQSLLLIGTQPRDLEKILARQNGGSVPSLGEQPVFQANFNSLFRDATAFAWIDFKPIFQQMMKPDEKPAAAEPPGGMGPNLKREKILPALGLGDLKSIALKFAFKPEGIEAQAFVGVPESGRQGLLKILAPPAKETAPPAFVPADAVKFFRTRIDFSQSWTVVENALIKIDPGFAGIIQLLLGAAGKDKDPNFDLKKSLIESLGDDYISYEKAPKDSVVSDLRLIGARNPEQLLNGINILRRLAPEPIGTTPMKEREFLGKKILTMTMSPVPGPGSQLHFVASGGYVAVSADAAILEEFVRSGDGGGKALRDLPGFADAAQKAGGLNSGWFSFENQVETMRATFEDLKAQKERAPSGLSLNPLSEETQRLRNWLEGSSLPPFERVAKYFHYLMTVGSSTPEGISFKVSLPTPPGAK